MASANAAKVAIASEFLNAFSNIPKKQQGKVMEFIAKFRANPLAPSINYEKIASFKDQTLRSVRIDKVYRGIVKKPDTSNVFLLLWVDHHDKAYQWAENKKCTINPETGSLQVYEVDEVSLQEADSTKYHKHDSDSGEQPLFEEYRDRQLLKLGVPEELIVLVRKIITEDQLDNAARQLPAEASEALFALAMGYSLEEVYQEIGRSEAEEFTVDTEDYAKALENADTKRRFFVVEDDLILQEILDAPLEKWRVFLHPSQRNLVERDWNGPVRVLGGAGTGKTVVAMHRAKWLAQERFIRNEEKILLTTFTRNLAADIKENLGKICSDDTMKRIEVINLDRWVAHFLRKHDYNYEIDYGKKSAPLWEKALSLAPEELGLGDQFYREEWERIIQPYRISTFAEYAKVSRVGRGTRLNRKERKLIWPVFEEYRLLMNEKGLRENVDAIGDARALLKDKGDILPYKAVIVDEAQDMSGQAFELIRQMVPGGNQKNDIFIVGDAHQRIYRHKVVLGQCGINIVGRGRRLKINYRTTDENRKWAVNLLKGVSFDDLDGGLDDQRGYKSLVYGEAPVVKVFTSFQEEIEFINNYLERVEAEGGALNEVCLVARTHELLKQYEGVLTAKSRETFFIHRSEAENRKIPGIRLATMHRVKGLEFDRVVIAGVNDGMVPFTRMSEGTSDKVVERESEIQERALLYVAATRAKREVVVTSFGKVSKFLGPQQLCKG
ncbi:UvrD-helicase domain-containing protein [Desulfosediminicola ganghwensis]|uniref:UvrD-helicase domain-containing protein n=1 Tax=Desulfosediminicola ganghwensis TaxID=2569540 RepID=UPI0010AC057C|nr:UvrD-helicase domain-containing protein [Desulfosediminicola ganghwensis]